MTGTAPTRYAPDILRQYAVEQSVPDIAVYQRDYEQRSVATRARGGCTLDVAYGKHPREKLDIFPAGKDAPFLVFIHGGGWRGGSKDGRAFAADTLALAGAGFVSLQYPLLPEVTLDDCVASIRAGLSWVERNIAAHGGDPERIHVCGNSAGGQLAAVAMLPERWGGPGRCPARSGCFVSGVFDMEPLRQGNANSWLRMDDASVARNSAIRHAADPDCPLIVAVGGDEPDEFRRQSREFAQDGLARGVAVRFIELAGHNHFSIIGEIFSASSPLFAALVAQMGLSIMR
jgi:arylformamidase